MVGMTKEEQMCPECNGMMRAYCTGPEYWGGMCPCKCHEAGDAKYEYTGGQPKLKKS